MESTTPAVRCLLSVCLLMVGLPVVSAAPPAAGSDPKVEERPPVRLTVRDVVLNSRGSLNLQVVDTSGSAVSGTVVQVRFQNDVIAEARTNDDGRIIVTGLRPGLHTVTGAGASSALRLWAQGTAPPSAMSAPVLVTADETIRGQYGYGPPMIAPGLLATGVTAAAVSAVVIGKNSGNNAHLAPASP
ncbi:MAG: carboxypeptidase-like regulatory domain-containing protein [Planctomycetaceae bacterium]